MNQLLKKMTCSSFAHGAKRKNPAEASVYLSRIAFFVTFLTPFWREEKKDFSRIKRGKSFSFFFLVQKPQKKKNESLESTWDREEEGNAYPTKTERERETSSFCQKFQGLNGLEKWGEWV